MAINGFKEWLPWFNHPKCLVVLCGSNVLKRGYSEMNVKYTQKIPETMV
jgi:hypothetical protein